jgi:hypothetical protein
LQIAVEINSLIACRRFPGDPPAGRQFSNQMRLGGRHLKQESFMTNNLFNSSFRKSVALTSALASGISIALLLAAAPAAHGQEIKISGACTNAGGTMVISSGRYGCVSQPQTSGSGSSTDSDGPTIKRQSGGSGAGAGNSAPSLY